MRLRPFFSLLPNQSQTIKHEWRYELKQVKTSANFDISLPSDLRKSDESTEECVKRGRVLRRPRRGRRGGVDVEDSNSKVEYEVITDNLEPEEVLDRLSADEFYRQVNSRVAKGEIWNNTDKCGFYKRTIKVCVNRS